MAERLTYRDENGKAWAKLKTSASSKEAMNFGKTSLDRLAAYEDTGLTPEELAALKEAAERIVLMWDNGYIEPYSADVKDYIENMRKAIKEADNADR